jgi:hypothetical protein
VEELGDLAAVGDGVEYTNRARALAADGDVDG